MGVWEGMFEWVVCVGGLGLVWPCTGVYRNLAMFIALIIVHAQRKPCVFSGKINACTIMWEGGG